MTESVNKYEVDNEGSGKKLKLLIIIEKYYPTYVLKSL